MRSSSSRFLRNCSASGGLSGSSRSCAVRRPNSGERSASTSRSMNETCEPHTTSMSLDVLPVVSQKRCTSEVNPFVASHR